MKKMVIVLSLIASVSITQAQQTNPNIDYSQVSRNGAIAQSAWQTIRESNIRASQVQKQTGHQEWRSTYNVVVQTPNNNASPTTKYHFSDQPNTLLNNTNTMIDQKVTQVTVDQNRSYNDLRRESRSAIVVRVFPNPSTDGRFTITFPDVNTLYNIQLIGLNGTIVQQWNSVNGNNYQINVQQPGTYIINVLDRNNLLVGSQKIIYSR
jgi:hypothetical protein